MSDEAIKRIPLDNGLTLEVFDRSRKVAADRWRVTVEAVINVPVTAEVLNGAAAPPVEEVRRVLGDTAVYSKKSERNFIDDQEKDAVSGALLDSLLESGLSYYANPAFGRNFVVRAYREKAPKSSHVPPFSR